MPSKLRLAHLKNARLVWVEHLKKQKLERSQLTNTEQLRVDDDQLCISDTSDMSHTEDGEGQKVSGSGMRAQTKRIPTRIVVENLKSNQIVGLKSLGLKKKQT